MEKALTQFKNGEAGLILRLELPADIRKKLMEMGLTTGAKILLKQSAPLGDPLWIEVRGYDLVLRKSEAAHIYLQQVQSPEGS